MLLACTIPVVPVSSNLKSDHFTSVQKSQATQETPMPLLYMRMSP